MKYVVTGAAGFIGSQLAERLLELGHEVAAVDCFTDYYGPALKEENAARLDVARIDLAETDLELDGVDGVFHLAGQPGVRSFGDVFEEYVRRNLLASRRVFEAAAAAGVRVAFASSSSIYGDAEAYPTSEDAEPRPISPYGITKLGCEQLAYAYAQGFGLDVVVLRYFTFYGPRQRPDMALARIVGEELHSAVPIDALGTRSRRAVGKGVGLDGKLVSAGIGQHQRMRRAGVHRKIGAGLTKMNRMRAYVPHLQHPVLAEFPL
jgi:nucleoside-diphosphate-sugar epimerase